jgi:hypothetical protein
MDYQTARAIYEAADVNPARHLALESDVKKEPDKDYSVRVLGGRSFSHEDLTEFAAISAAHDVRFDIRHGFGFFSS